MSAFSDAIAVNPPRLVVLYRRADSGDDQFQWGVVGAIPLLSLIGAIVRLQGDLTYRAIEPCDEPALAMLWDDATRRMTCFLHPGVPVDPLNGMLEGIKLALAGSKQSQRAVANQSPILGPDGGPMKR